MTNEINQRYIKFETNGNLPAKMLEQLNDMARELVSNHPEFFEGEPREQTYGRVLQRLAGLPALDDDKGCVVRNPRQGGS